MGFPGMCGPAFPASPASLVAACQQSNKIRASDLEYWWPGGPHFQAGINGGVITQALNITAATNASPIVFTTDKPHGFLAGDSVTIKGINGNTNGNTTGTVAASPGSTTFSLTGVNGNATYQGGGTAQGPKTNGESADMWNIAGAGCMTEITLILNNVLTFNDSQLWIYIDGDVAGSPSIQIALCDICGLHNSILLSIDGLYDWGKKVIGNSPPLKTDHMELQFTATDLFNQVPTSGIRLVIKYPIPFSTACRATLFQCGSFDNTSTNTWVIAEYTNQVVTNLRFNCQTLPVMTKDGTSPIGQFNVCATGADYTLFSSGNNKPGWVVGTGISFESFANDSTGSTVLERNVYAFRDGESSASYKSSGMEDYFNSCNYFGNMPFQQLNGAYLSFGRPSGTGNGQYSADLAFYNIFKDNLQSDGGGLGYNLNVTLKSMYQPDGSARVLSSANMRSWTFFYQ